MGVRVVRGSASLVYAINGTAGAPSISFAAGPTDGLFRISAGTIGMAGNGTQMLQFSSGGISWGNGADMTIARVGAGSLSIGGATNGQLTGVQVLAENVVIAAAATSTSIIQLPANAILLGVTSRVTTVGVTSWPATYSVAIGATTVSSGISTALNTTDPGTLLCPIQKAAATPITITPATTPGDAIGRIRCTVHYIQLTPPTS